MKKILCATDHSELAQKAEVFSAHCAKAFGAELVYAYVSHITKKDMKAKANRSSLAILKDFALQEDHVLSHARKVADEAGIPEAKYVILRSHKIALTLVEYAEEEGVDHIVVGSAVHAGFTRGVRGSVSGQISAGSFCPVTFVC